MEETWYHIEDVENLDSPALVIYPDRVKSNIGLLKSMVNHTDRLRPHVKTHKSKEITSLLIDEGISKFKCATIAEAEMLGICKAKDVLLAYQPTKTKLARFINLIRQYPETHYSCLIDNITTATFISEKAIENQLTLAVYIDLNVGMNRTGIHADESAKELYKQCKQLPAIVVKGFHAYDGHIYEKDVDKRQQICQEAFKPVENLINDLKQEGYHAINLIAGGTPTFPIHAKQQERECSPGTFVFWDKGYQQLFHDQQFLPAALVISRVISIPEKNYLCLDLGYKAIASENNLDRRVFFLNAPDLKPVSHSEEHLVVESPESYSFKIGDVLYALPFHICPTVALYADAITIVHQKPGEKWKVVARDRELTI